MVDVKIKRLNDKAVIPTYATDGSIGLDLVAVSEGVIDNNQYIEYKTGLAIELPKGFEGEIRPRSSIRDYNLILSNSPGTIDTDYRGELTVSFISGSKINKGFIYKEGDKIAQLVISEKPKIKFIEVKELDKTIRGENGFGSSGS